MLLNASCSVEIFVVIWHILASFVAKNMHNVLYFFECNNFNCTRTRQHSKMYRKKFIVDFGCIEIESNGRIIVYFVLHKQINNEKIVAFSVFVVTIGRKFAGDVWLLCGSTRKRNIFEIVLANSCRCWETVDEMALTWNDNCSSIDDILVSDFHEKFGADKKLHYDAIVARILHFLEISEGKISSGEEKQNEFASTVDSSEENWFCLVLWVQWFTGGCCCCWRKHA